MTHVTGAQKLSASRYCVAMSVIAFPPLITYAIICPAKTLARPLDTLQKKDPAGAATRGGVSSSTFRSVGKRWPAGCRPRPR
jgi:hypothetical protein